MAWARGICTQVRPTDTPVSARYSCLNRLASLWLRWCGVGLRHSRRARPWENGYIERFFGTFKRSLADLVMRDASQLRGALPAFRFGYNVTRPHQHFARPDTPAGVVGHRSAAADAPFGIVIQCMGGPPARRRVRVCGAAGADVNA